MKSFFGLLLAMLWRRALLPLSSHIRARRRQYRLIFLAPVTSTTLADFLETGFPNGFFVTHGWSAFGGPTTHEEHIIGFGRSILTRWLKPFLDRLGHKARRRMCPLYVAGLRCRAISRPRVLTGWVLSTLEK